MYTSFNYLLGELVCDFLLFAIYNTLSAKKISNEGHAIDLVDNAIYGYIATK